MSYTPCPRCGEPLMGYEGSPCSNPHCEGYRGKPLPEHTHRNRHLLRADRPGKALKRAFKGIR